MHLGVMKVADEMTTVSDFKINSLSLGVLESPVKSTKMWMNSQTPGALHLWETNKLDTGEKNA